MARSYQELQQLSQAAPSGNLLQRILTGTIQAPKRLLESAQYASSDPGQYTPLFESSTPQDISSAIDDPGLNLLKTIATGASFAVPGGTGVKGLAVSGAKSGVLGGIGMSEKGEELSGALTGGLTGGVVGGGLGLAGGALSKLFGGKIGGATAKTKIPDKLKSTIFKGIKNTDDLTPALLKQTQKEMFEEASNRGITLLDSSDLANNIDDIVSAARTTSDELGSQAVISGGKQRILNKISKQFDTDILFKDAPSDATRAVSGLKQSIQALPDNPTALQLTEINREIARASGNYNKLTKGATPKINNLRQLRGILRNEISEFAPEASQALSKTERFLDVSDQVAKAVQKTTKPGVSPFAQVPINVRIPAERAATKTAGLLESLGGTGAGVSPGLSQGISRITPRASQLGSLAAIFGGGQGGEVTGVGAEQSMPAEFGGLGGVPQGGMSQEGQIVLELLGRGLSLNEATTLAEYFGGGGGEQTTLADLKPAERVHVSNAQQAAQALQLLESGAVEGGVFRGAQSSLGRLFGGLDPNQAEYESIISGIGTSIQSDLIGANQTPSEVKRLKDAIPTVQDRPEEAAIKLRKLLETSVQLSGVPAEQIFSL